MKIMCNYQTMGEITRILSTVIHEEFYTFWNLIIFVIK
jgi:hypothetical protein